MNGIVKSLALTSLFPETVLSPDALERTLRWLKQNRSFGMVEFYTAPGEDGRIARVLAELGFESVFIAVVPLKAAGFSLCAADEGERARAVAVLKSCIDRAGAAGARRIMINSGFIPDRAADIEKSCDSYVRSVLEAARYIEERKIDLLIELEPGDSRVQSRQLLGPTDRVLETTRRIREQTDRYVLAMDVAHLREESEPVMDALRATKPFCDHIHLCNCVMDDPAHPLYGDKHVDFDQEGAAFAYGDFERMFGEIKRLYAGEGFIATLEITCREADNFAWFDRVAARCAWLFQ